MAIDKEVDPILIAFVKHNRLHFSSNTFSDILSKVGPRPVAVVAISPPNGEEKEQVFNGCLKYLETLDLDKNVRKGRIWKTKSDTDAKGIYICPEPIIIRKSCQEVGVVLMEINGKFDPKDATREDLMILALSYVLSSTLIYSFEENFSNELQEFLQILANFGKGGVGPEMSESCLNLILLVDNWKSAVRYPFGYHDSATCPFNGKKLFNYRNDTLDFTLSPDKTLEETVANKNKFFVDSYQKIVFALMPGKDSQMADPEEEAPKFGEIWPKIVIRLLHPSNLAIKEFDRKKITGHKLVSLFEQISALMAETDNNNETEENFKTRISNMAKEITDQVVYKKVGFNGQQSNLDVKISQLIGFNLETLAEAVRSVIGTN